MTAPMKLPSLEFLRECFLYEAGTGKLFWKRRPKHHFDTAARQKSFNTKYAGKECFRADDRGYRGGTLYGQGMYTHRIVWKLMTGKEPPPIVDHADRDKSNNRWGNLRAATIAQNAVNTRKTAGVCFDRSRGKWMAYTKIKRRMINIGRFDTKREALAARRAKIVDLHGEFAPQ